MSLLDKLSDPAVWEGFYSYKTGLACPKAFTKELREFIDGKRYLPVSERLFDVPSFPLPRKAVISKMGSTKKRTVYIYPEPENTVLKLLTYLLLRKYDGIFSGNLYSFRPGRSAKDAMRKLIRTPGIRGLYAYKVDISNYFNSVDLSLLLPALKETLSGDPELYLFLSGLLKVPLVLEEGKPVEEEKGIMAGTPLSSFYANLFLKKMDEWFEERRIPYARYSDDVIVFADSPEKAEEYADVIRSFLSGRCLSVNPVKEEFFTPETGFTFLGFSYRNGAVDIAPATIRKLKDKMRRKARALERWRDRNGLERERAAKAFIRVFNRKLMESSPDNDLSWSRWFFSVINRTDSLQVIDRYAADNVRFLLTGKRTKGRFNARYTDLKALGFQSLVHAFYAFEKEEREKTSGKNAGGNEPQDPGNQTGSADNAK